MSRVLPPVHERPRRQPRQCHVTSSSPVARPSDGPLLRSSDTPSPRGCSLSDQQPAVYGKYPTSKQRAQVLPQCDRNIGPATKSKAARTPAIGRSGRRATAPAVSESLPPSDGLRSHRASSVHRRLTRLSWGRARVAGTAVRDAEDPGTSRPWWFRALTLCLIRCGSQCGSETMPGKIGRTAVSLRAKAPLDAQAILQARMVPTVAQYGYHDLQSGSIAGRHRRRWQARHDEWSTVGQIDDKKVPPAGSLPFPRTHRVTVDTIRDRSGSRRDMGN